MSVNPGEPVKLQTTSDYATPDPANKGGPKYGHYAALDPEFAKLKPAIDANIAQLFAIEDWAAFRAAWLAPSPLPAGCPQPGTDVHVRYTKMPTRDGAEIELKIMEAAATTHINKDATDNVCVLRLHGGGWSVGGHETEAVENLRVAHRPGVVLVSVDYRLAPEYRYPYPLNDCEDALRWVQAHAAELRINPAKIVLLGGSAGSNLALALALRAREAHVGGIVGMVLDWPTGAHPKFFPQLRERDGYELESYGQNFYATVVTPPVMEFFLASYTPDPQPDPGHSPLLADSFKDLPPALLQIAGYDPLRDEGLAVAEKLKKDGVPTEVHVYAGLPHVFSSLLPELPQSKDLFARQEAFIDKIVKGTN
ncbi:alpha/beta hydrolase fold-3 domain-containing protein [Niveomyces insectorum RCEF 264]|uniref:Alpha/beta hydrolase fold-3 domain-containing protein n=1 Tax=Niveomyces insectorum RCEF 264 TaxID=1081102 RepID=A0A167YRK9_9HYPO|nr:alpha/beta hydrolase fold-3 domain-containing protein [Niveomyces insectorum RCEF 264]